MDNLKEALKHLLKATINILDSKGLDGKEIAEFINTAVMEAWLESIHEELQKNKE